MIELAQNRSRGIGNRTLLGGQATKEIVMPAPAEGGALSQYRLQCHGVVCNFFPPTCCPPLLIGSHQVTGRTMGHNAFASLGWYLLPAALHRESSLVLVSCGSPPSPRPRGGGQRFHFRLPFLRAAWTLRKTSLSFLSTLAPRSLSDCAAKRMTLVETLCWRAANDRSIFLPWTSWDALTKNALLLLRCILNYCLGQKNIFIYFF